MPCECLENFHFDGTVSTVIERPCRYHNEEGKVYTPGEYNENKLCPFAYYAAYPFCLALHFDAEFKDGGSGGSPKRISVKCPSVNSSLEMEVYYVRRLPPYIDFTNFVKTIIRAGLKLMGFPQEIITKDVFIGIKEAKDCPMKHAPGQVFRFNLYKSEYMCPAGLSALFPMVLRKSKNISLPWGGDLTHCPDHKGIVYRIKGH